uniref:Uncharacterized protein n=1 Tax=Rhizophora mucronata TaxID=61149 RepID=A0A2P2IIE3_RHIMU
MLIGEEFQTLLGALQLLLREGCENLSFLEELS